MSLDGMWVSAIAALSVLAIAVTSITAIKTKWEGAKLSAAVAWAWMLTYREQLLKAVGYGHSAPVFQLDRPTVLALCFGVGVPAFLIWKHFQKEQPPEEWLEAKAAQGEEADLTECPTDWPKAHRQQQ
jgi:hypothetical protein